jgi:hypothetical protein
MQIHPGSPTLQEPDIFPSRSPWQTHNQLFIHHHPLPATQSRFVYSFVPTCTQHSSFFPAISTATARNHSRVSHPFYALSNRSITSFLPLPTNYLSVCQIQVQFPYHSLYRSTKVSLSSGLQLPSILSPLPLPRIYLPSRAPRFYTTQDKHNTKSVLTKPSPNNRIPPSVGVQR